ncbi:MAG: hypothetical protein HHJ11_01355 [Phycicoccus sp.]|nr:hypothetical protein [Phycicoccus sp.]NMM32469.1 hypothetical protein [Phycicoccus sp.]
MGELKNRRVFIVALMLGAFTGITAVAVNAHSNDANMPEAKRNAITSVTTIDPVEINNGSHSTFSPWASDVGPAEQVAQVKDVAVALFGDYYSLGAMPQDMAARHEYIVGAAGKAKRAAELARVWAADGVADELNTDEKGMLTFDGDTTSVGYTRAVFVVTSWRNVTVQGNTASVRAVGYIKYLNNDGSTSNDPTWQWQLELVRGDSPDNYHGWRLAKRIAAEVPEGVSDTAG